MKFVFRDLSFPFFLLIIVNICAVFSIPILPIDETRYLSVAWEMWNDHSFLVPLLNGVAYAHKPPMLFWLIHTGWAVFGVNSVTPRLTILLFSLINLVLVYRISLRLWPTSRKAAQCAVLVLASTFVWVLWSCAIMFDMVLTFWILWGVTGVLLAAERRRSGWALLILGFAGGLLTKGPAVLVYLIPLSLGVPGWRDRSARKWVGMVLLCMFIGIMIASLWVIPAVIVGGQDYRDAILWGQTAGRMVSSFAHRRPFWWYLPIVPALFMPWILFRPVFASLKLEKMDSGVRYCLLWIGVPLFIFSLVSGKQVHYLLPLIPAGVLLAGRSLGDWKEDIRPSRAWMIGGLYGLLGLIVFILSFFPLNANIGTLPPGPTRALAVALILSGLVVGVSRFQSVLSAIRAIATVTALIIGLTLLYTGTGIMELYQLTPVAKRIQCERATGRPVVHVGKYRGQYHFLGRLKQPLPVVGSRQRVLSMAAVCPETLFISYASDVSKLPAGAVVRYSHPYRGKTVFLWDIPGGSK